MGKLIPFFLILFLSDFLLMFSGCENSLGASERTQKGEETVITDKETYPLFVKFRSFQNLDSTWGYTVFVNSRPYLHYSRIHYKDKGFDTKHDAEIVASLIVKMIQKGEMTPKLNKKLIDSLDMQMKHPK